MRPTPTRTNTLLAAALAFGVLGCDEEADDYPIDAAVFGDAADLGEIEARRHVFVATNHPAGNEVVAYLAFDDGALVERARASTGGAGAMLGDAFDPLQSQDSLIYVEGKIFVVNAGSDTVSSLVFENRGPDAAPRLELLSVEGTGGEEPISVTYYDENLFVVNRDGTIAGYGVDEGRLTPKPGGSLALPDGVAPATIEYRLDGDDLLVTDRANDGFLLVELSGGEPLETRVFASSGVTPFGAEFIGEDVFAVANASAPGGGPPQPNESSVTTYELLDRDVPKAVEARVPSGQTGAARVAVFPRLEWLYTANMDSGSLSAYALDDDGELRPGPTTSMPQGSIPLDMAIDAHDDVSLYVLDGGRGTIAIYRVRSDGRLVVVDEDAAPGLVAGQVYGLDVESNVFFDLDSDW